MTARRFASLAAVLPALLCGPALAAADPPGLPAIERPLTEAPGDAARGRAIVADRTRGLCLLCHSGPFPEAPFQGTLAPSLAGAGSRLTPGELRQRMVDSRVLNADTIMPAYFSTEGLTQVAPAFRGKPILEAQEIEDVVAFLATLKEP